MGANKRCCDAEIAIGACDANGSRRRVLSSLRRRQLQWTSQSNMVHSIKPWHVADSTHPWRMLTAIGSENIWGRTWQGARLSQCVQPHEPAAQPPEDRAARHHLKQVHSRACVCARARWRACGAVWSCVFACAVWVCGSGSSVVASAVGSSGASRRIVDVIYVSTLTGN